MLVHAAEGCGEVSPMRRLCSQARALRGVIRGNRCVGVVGPGWCGDWLVLHESGGSVLEFPSAWSGVVDYHVAGKYEDGGRGMERKI